MLDDNGNVVVNVRCDPRFIYFGRTEYAARHHTGGDPDNMPYVCVPFPSSGPFETAVNVDSARNQNGEMVGQEVGRPIDKQSMTFNVIKREKWHEINRWIRANGIKFWCYFYNHNHGGWECKRFYCGNRSCEPYMINPATGVPAFYRNAKINVIDMGVVWE